MDWTDRLNRFEGEGKGMTASSIDQAQTIVLMMTPSQRALFASWMSAVVAYEKYAPVPRGGPGDL